MLRNPVPCPVPSTAPEAVPARLLRLSALIGRGASSIAPMLERGRQRRALLSLDDSQLRDIGLTRLDVELECAKPIWRP